MARRGPVHGERCEIFDAVTEPSFIPPGSEVLSLLCCGFGERIII
jgi:hypothetical protein